MDSQTNELDSNIKKISDILDASKQEGELVGDLRNQINALLARAAKVEGKTKTNAIGQELAAAKNNARDLNSKTSAELKAIKDRLEPATVNAENDARQNYREKINNILADNKKIKENLKLAGLNSQLDELNRAISSNNRILGNNNIDDLVAEENNLKTAFKKAEDALLAKLRQDLKTKADAQSNLINELTNVDTAVKNAFVSVVNAAKQNSNDDINTLKTKMVNLDNAIELANSKKALKDAIKAAEALKGKMQNILGLSSEMNALNQKIVEAKAKLVSENNNQKIVDLTNKLKQMTQDTQAKYDEHAALVRETETLKNSAKQFSTTNLTNPDFYGVIKKDLENELVGDLNSMTISDLKVKKASITSKKSEVEAKYNEINPKISAYQNAKQKADNYHALVRDLEASKNPYEAEITNKASEKFEAFKKDNDPSKLQEVINIYNKAEGKYDSLIAEQKSLLEAQLSKFAAKSSDANLYTNKNAVDNTHKIKNKPVPIDPTAQTDFRRLSEEFSDQTNRRPANVLYNKNNTKTKTLKTIELANLLNEKKQLFETYETRKRNILESNFDRASTFTGYEKAKKALFDKLYEHRNDVQLYSIEQEVLKTLKQYENLTENTQDSQLVAAKNALDGARNKIELNEIHWQTKRDQYSNELGDPNSSTFEKYFYDFKSEFDNWYPKAKANGGFDRYPDVMRENLDRIQRWILPLIKELTKENKSIFSLKMAVDMKRLIVDYYKDWKAFGSNWDGNYLRRTFAENAKNDEKTRFINYLKNIYRTEGQYDRWWTDAARLDYAAGPDRAPRFNEIRYKYDSIGYPFWYATSASPYQITEVWYYDGYSFIMKKLLRILAGTFDWLKGTWRPAESMANRYKSSSYNYVNQSDRRTFSLIFTQYLDNEKTILRKDALEILWNSFNKYQKAW
ncbi:hypothetical protein [Mycoplasma struthionis]|uniref:Uncharacterized protein n=1 Tax=Mycoplasma struthionis TaxID=538220 RepID=A0A502M2V7_9MOLU|nr:hypothetical protein [Mycoplasma struthionis]TPI02958.1 hypothetical protein FJM01_00195 [Mycoplasma struthionis]